MSDHSPILVWFRNDLRLDDHPALHAAAKSKRPVIPVYLWSPEAEAPWPRGGASRWWLHHALVDLGKTLSDRGSKLVLRMGTDPFKLLRDLLEETGAGEIHWNRRYDPAGVKTDTALKKNLPAKSFLGSVLREPHEIETQNGEYYKVYTPFYKNVISRGDPREPLDAPDGWMHPDSFPKSEVMDDWNLLPKIGWDKAFYDEWTPTLAGAEAQMEAFLESAAGDYKDERDFPAKPGTSRISPYLHFGQISPRRLWHDAKAAAASGDAGGKGVDAWLRQLVWRDFAIHLLFHQPQLDLEPMQEKFSAFPWENNPDHLQAWQRGQTGYPIVDAGMRELWTTGWMHNRVRMIVASFLVKDLRIHWHEGAKWFWDTLVDADLANNSFGWQWAAGCGADAAPYFRIFNPMLQSKKFDGEGAYIRKWVPELKGLSPKDIHAPWEMDAPPEAYPEPIVDHALARDEALEALSSLKD